MGILRTVLTYLIWFYLLLLIIRMIFSWIQAFSRDWRPRGAVLVWPRGCSPPRIRH